MGGDSEQITEVQIYNRTYHVRSHGDADYVRSLASYVHERMTEVSEHTPTVDSLKVAILAALNIADEYFSVKQKLQDTERLVSDKSGEMAAWLDPLLEPRSP